MRRLGLILLLILELHLADNTHVLMYIILKLAIVQNEYFLYFKYILMLILFYLYLYHYHFLVPSTIFKSGLLLLVEYFKTIVFVLLLLNTIYIFPTLFISRDLQIWILAIFMETCHKPENKQGVIFKP